MNVPSAKGELQRIVQALVATALTRTLTSEKSWNYGWCTSDYRRSDRATIGHDDSHGVHLSPEGVEAFERAIHQLFKISEVRDRYDSEEFWGIVAEMIGSLPMSSNAAALERHVAGRLEHLLSPPDAVVVVPIANVDPGSLLIEVGPLMIGRSGELWRDGLEARSPGHLPSSNATSPWWESAANGLQKEDIVLLGYFGRAQLNRAFHDAEDAFDNLIALALMLEPDLDSIGLFGLRGDSHRPGIRGLAVDRQSLRNVAETNPAVLRELGAEVLVSGLLGTSVTHHWYGEEPFPLHRLLDAPRLVEARRLLIGRTSICNRLRLAARWHAKAHWSSEIGDAVLALGIGFEALLSESNPSPGRVLGERFAFLAQSPSERPARYKLFLGEYYAARSSIAHGAKRTSIDGTFVRQMAGDLRETFIKLASLTKDQSIEAENAYNQLFEGLKWGG